MRQGAALVLFGAGACGGGVTHPDLEARNSLGYVIFDLYTRSSGYHWSDDHGSGAITLGADVLTDSGDLGDSSNSRCGPSGDALCRASFSNGRIDIVMPDASSRLPQTYGLARVAGAITLDDGAGGVLLTLSPNGDGTATIHGRQGGSLIATTQKSDGGIVVVNADKAYVGAVDGRAPPEIAALALGPSLDSSGSPHIPDLPIVIASALAWLK